MQDLRHGDAEKPETVQDPGAVAEPGATVVIPAPEPDAAQADATVVIPTTEPAAQADATIVIPPARPADPAPGSATNGPVPTGFAPPLWLAPLIDRVRGSLAPVVAPVVAPLGRWVRPRRRPVAWMASALAVLAVAAMVAYSATGATGQPGRRFSALPGGASASASPSKPAPPPSLKLSPANHTGGVPVRTPVTVTAISSTLDSVMLVGSQGQAVTGAFGPDRRTWRSSGPLEFGTRYTLSAVATKDAGTTAKMAARTSATASSGGTAAGTAGGAPVGGTTASELIRSSASFTTVEPSILANAYLDANAYMQLSSRSTYGVGQPIVVIFDEPVWNRAVAQAALSVHSTPATYGAWHWFGNQEVHWRPESYWRPGTQVTVTANLYGVGLGHGTYGAADVSDSFVIGASHIAIADDHTNEMKVYVNGALVRTIPVAMGLHSTVTSTTGQVIDLRTHTGVHVVLMHSSVTRMTSASYGLTGPGGYDEPVYWTTKITYDGEYVHAAPWSVAQQGHTDASHGCINVSTSNAIWFYNTFIPGDIVDVLNTGLPLPATDGLGDWTLSWPQWLAGSALPA